MKDDDYLFKAYKADVYQCDILRGERARQWGRLNLSIISEKGRAKVRDKLAEGNLPFVVSIANGYQGFGVDFLDLIQEGNIGLMRAAEKYDGRFNFTTYAYHWIRRGVLLALKNQSRTVRIPIYMQERERALQEVYAGNEHLNGEPRSVMHIERETLDIMDAELSDCPVVEDARSVLEDRELTEALWDVVDALPKEESDFVRMCYKDGMSMNAISRKSGQQREIVRNQKRNALVRLRRRVGALMGIESD